MIPSTLLRGNVRPHTLLRGSLRPHTVLRGSGRTGFIGQQTEFFLSADWVLPVSGLGPSCQRIGFLLSAERVLPVSESHDFGSLSNC